eukprot:m.21785 g.21785  ORF g.21785 m.21785 type:complete len:57 (-) comp12525_c0_seq1:916-1086(-)
MDGQAPHLRRQVGNAFPPDQLKTVPSTSVARTLSDPCMRHNCTYSRTPHWFLVAEY